MTPSQHEALKALLAMLRRGDAQGLPQDILKHVVAALEPSIACYYVPQANGKTLSCAAAVPDAFWKNDEIATHFDTRDIDSYGIGVAVRQGSVHLVSDPKQARAKDEYEEFAPDITSELIAPVFADGQLMGVIIASARQPRVFGDDERRLCETIVSILSAVYQAFGERDKLQARVQLLRAFNALPPEDLERAVNRGLEALAAFLPSKFISMWLYNELDETLVLRGFHPTRIGLRPIALITMGEYVLSLDGCLSGQTFRDKHFHLFLDIEQNVLNANQTFAREFGLTWFVSFPVLSDQRVVGIVNVYPNVTPAELPLDTLEFSEACLAVLGRLIDANMIVRSDEVRQRFSALCRRMRDKPPRDYWDSVSQEVKHDVGCEAASVFLLDRDSGDLVLVGTTGMDGTDPYHAMRYSVGEGITGRTLQRRFPLTFYLDKPADLEGRHSGKFKEVLESGQPSRSMLYYPIYDSASNVVGVLRCINKRIDLSNMCGRFTANDVKLLDRITSIALDRAPERVAEL